MSEMVVKECAKQVVKAKPFAKAQLRLAKHSPEIMIGVGLVGVVTSTVLACRATLKAPAVLEAAKEKFADIEEARVQGEEGTIEYSKKDRQQDLVTASVQTGFEFAKLYAIPAVIMGASLFAITKGHGITMKRNAAISSAFAALSAGYGEYRDRVREKYGEEAERDIYYGVKHEEVAYMDKKGKEKIAKIPVSTLPLSPYAREFSNETTIAWSPSTEMNLTFLRCQQNYANEILNIRGHVFLNEIYDALGLSRTSKGAVVGWVKDPGGDNFVDFGIAAALNYYESMDWFVTGDEPSPAKPVLFNLDFNVDGIIYDLL